jgi:hypothetical protein
LRHHFVHLGLAFVIANPSLPVYGCEILITEDRSAVELKRVPLSPSNRRFVIAFEHSVLGTTVTDHYEWRDGPHGSRAWLVEERFRGDGYGLASSASTGERLVRDGEDSRLLLNREVNPLVVRPIKAQNMRLVTQPVSGPLEVLVLSDLGSRAQRLSIERCE